MLAKRGEGLLSLFPFEVEALAGRTEEGARGLGKEVEVFFVEFLEIDDFVVEKALDAVSRTEDSLDERRFPRLDDGSLER